MAGKYVVIHEKTPFINQITGEVTRYGGEVDLSDRKMAKIRPLLERGILADASSDEAKKATAAAEKARRAEEREG